MSSFCARLALVVACSGLLALAANSTAGSTTSAATTVTTTAMTSTSTSTTTKPLPCIDADYARRTSCNGDVYGDSNTWCRCTGSVDRSTFPDPFAYTINPRSTYTSGFLIVAVNTTNMTVDYSMVAIPASDLNVTGTTDAGFPEHIYLFQYMPAKISFGINYPNPAPDHPYAVSLSTISLTIQMGSTSQSPLAAFDDHFCPHRPSVRNCSIIVQPTYPSNVNLERFAWKTYVSDADGHNMTAFPAISLRSSWTSISLPKRCAPYSIYVAMQALYANGTAGPEANMSKPTIFTNADVPDRPSAVTMAGLTLSAHSVSVSWYDGADNGGCEGVHYTVTFGNDNTGDQYASQVVSPGVQSAVLNWTQELTGGRYVACVSAVNSVGATTPECDYYNVAGPTRTSGTPPAVVAAICVGTLLGVGLVVGAVIYWRRTRRVAQYDAI